MALYNPSTKGLDYDEILKLQKALANSNISAQEAANAAASLSASWGNGLVGAANTTANLNRLYYSPSLKKKPTQDWEPEARISPAGLLRNINGLLSRIQEMK